MKALTTAGLTKLIQLIKSSFISVDDTVTTTTVTLADVATTGDYDDLTDKPTIGDATITIQKNGTAVDSFTANATNNKTINITVPTKTSDLTNDDGFITGISSSDVTTALGYTPADSASLATVATSGDYDDLTDKPTIGNATITINQGNITKGTFTVNQTSDATINLDAAGSSITIDSAMSDTSENPVQNKIITAALADKQNEISDLSDIRSGASAGATALQPNDNVSELINDAGYITSSSVGTGVLTIQKNGTAVDTFSANASADKTINITVPTTASDVNALPNTTKYAATITASLNTTTYKLTITLKDQNGDTLGQAQEVDFPCESALVGVAYNSNDKSLTLTTQSGSTSTVDISGLISGLQPEITQSNKLSADLVDDTSTTNKFVTAADITNWNSKQPAGNYVTYNGSSAIGSGTQGVYINSSGEATTMTYSLNKTVPSDAIFTDTDTKVTQTLKSDNNTYKMLMTPVNQSTTQTTTATFTNGMSINPGLGKLMIQPQGSQQNGLYEGAEIQLQANTGDNTQGGIILDNYQSNLRIFGMASADGTTKVGGGTNLEIDPWAKTIKGGYTFTGDVTGNAATATKATQDGSGNVITSYYMPVAVGVNDVTKMSSDLATKVDVLNRRQQNDAFFTNFAVLSGRRNWFANIDRDPAWTISCNKYDASIFVDGNYSNYTNAVDTSTFPSDPCVITFEKNANIDATDVLQLYFIHHNGTNYHCKKSIKIEVKYTNNNWYKVREFVDQDLGNFATGLFTSELKTTLGVTTNYIQIKGVRITISKWADEYFQLSEIELRTSRGSEPAYFGVNSVGRRGDTLAGNYIPIKTNTYNLGDADHKWGTVYATTFNGNATSASTATKATQDGSGNTITSSYYPVGTSARIFTSGDWDTLDQPGTYKIQVGSNNMTAANHAPEGCYGYGILYVMRLQDSTSIDSELRVTQVYYSHQTDSNTKYLMAVRTRNANTKVWGSWYIVCDKAKNDLTYVDFSSAQIISGTKTFKNDIMGGQIEVYRNSTNTPAIKFSNTAGVKGYLSIDPSTSIPQYHPSDYTNWNRLVRMPNKQATAVGSSTAPCYVDANGIAQACGNSLAVSVTGSSASCTGNAASATTAEKVNKTAGATPWDAVYVKGQNDYLRIRFDESTSNSGWAEIATADDGNEPIYVRQYTGVFSSIARTLTLLDGSGNTSIPGYLTIANSNGIVFTGSDPTLKKTQGGTNVNVFRVNSSGATIISTAVTSGQDICLRPQGDGISATQVNIHPDGSMGLMQDKVKLAYNSTTQALDFVFA